MTPTGYFLDHLWLIPLFPLATAALMFFFGKRLPNVGVSVLCVGSVGLSFIYAAGAVVQLLTADPEHRVAQQILFEWLTPGPLQMTGGHLLRFVADWGYLLDPLSCVIVLLVTGVGYYRFFVYMNLFMFAMLMLVLANNMLLLFVGWEGVGLCSYLLIGFYFLKKSASDAGKKAFIVNRIGDFGFMLGMFLLFRAFHTLDFQAIFTSSALQGWPVELSGHLGTLTFASLLIFMGACGKSAQLPLYVWLPDAMEGPTPVSALIHAATMVTAGVYVVARSHILFAHAPTAMLVVAIVGCATAFFAATIGLVQTDIKKVLAYSTVSQLGYMFLACGVGAFSAGIFHLMTHAFFKALLFLAAGSVIHAMGGEQDMNRMGGLSKKIRWTYLTMLTATLAIAGFPPLAGFFSKDSILLNAYQSEHGGRILYAFGLLTALLTSFYMFRLIFLTFHGKRRYNEHKVHVHESPKSMLVPLMILAVLSLIGGWVAAPAFWGGPDYFAKFLEPAFAQASVGNAEAADATARALETPLAVVAVVTALLGFAVAFWLYLQQPGKPEQLAKSMRGAYTTLLNKYYVDEIYAAAIVNPLMWLSTNVLWQAVDIRAIDATVNGIAEGASDLGDGVRHTQSGNTRSYAVWVVIGALVIIAIIFWPDFRPTTVGAVR